jgi:hypothetical protein
MREGTLKDKRNISTTYSIGQNHQTKNKETTNHDKYLQANEGNKNNYIDMYV